CHAVSLPSRRTFFLSDFHPRYGAPEPESRIGVSRANRQRQPVKQTMRRLRAKLGDPPVIHTVREGGYQIGGL
ncbi:MAG: helix-turn-helix domain-containing protein, partial [Gemmatimonadales bacterium]